MPNRRWTELPRQTQSLAECRLFPAGWKPCFDWLSPVSASGNPLRGFPASFPAWRPAHQMAHVELYSNRIISINSLHPLESRLAWKWTWWWLNLTADSVRPDRRRFGNNNWGPSSEFFFSWKSVNLAISRERGKQISIIWKFDFKREPERLQLIDMTDWAGSSQFNA